MLNKNRTFVLGFVGLLSGILTFLLFYLNILFPITSIDLLLYIPGIVFGFAIGLYYCLVKKKCSLQNLLLFALFSAISYTTAALTMIFPMPFILVASAMLGTFLLLLSFRSFVLPVTKINTTWMVIIGGALSLGAYFVIPFPIESLRENSAVLCLFAIWQTGMAITLGVATPESLPKGYKNNRTKDLKLFSIIVLIALLLHFVLVGI